MIDHPLTGPLKDRDEKARTQEGSRTGHARAPLRPRTKWFGLFVILLAACFGRPLYLLTQYSLHSEFFSYIPLIPAITLYLIWLKRPELPPHSAACWKWGVATAMGGIALLAGNQWALHSGHAQDYLTWMTGSFLLFLVAGSWIILGREMTLAIGFPFIFLVFMVPMPTAMLDWTTLFFQRTSAITAKAFLNAAFMPVFRENLTLNLPGFSLVVAPECSGIHSTMVLLITSVLAGHLFLRSPWKRVLLILVVVPLAIARNGFRIFVIGELCVRVSHDMINSPIHHKGGPLFFALSLIPFFGLLYLLRKSEPHEPKAVDALGKV